MKYSDLPEDKKEKMRAAHRRWKARTDRRPYYIAYDRDRRGRRKEYIMFTNSRMNAKKKNLEHTIQLEDIVIPKMCPCCLQPINRPSLDRVNNLKGYVLNNIKVICNHCNSVKRNGTADLHRKIADYIEEYS